MRPLRVVPERSRTRGHLSLDTSSMSAASEEEHMEQALRAFEKVGRDLELI
jgi:hypothetical protein